MRRASKFRLYAAAALLSLYSHAACAEVVVIVSNKNPLTVLSVEQVSDIFLGKTASFPDGTAAVPIDQIESSTLRQEFYVKTTGKTAQLLKAYWSKMIFTGRGEPPREIADSASIRKLVADNPHFIGYVERAAVDASVKVVLTVK
ncbi:MAG TPA: phosphate ABC transporter substrate-binding protein [Paucimonas sp.]|nr:phosphate ABC transporter substrate-binding protein [Paucimonas sp.]